MSPRPKEPPIHIGKRSFVPSSNQWNRAVRVGLWVCVAVLGVCNLVWLFAARHWPLVNDPALMHYVVSLMGQGLAPYREIGDYNFPGAYLPEWLSTHAAILLGISESAAWRCADALCLLACGVAMYRIARPWSRFAGIFASLLFALLHARDGIGQAGQRDLWMAALLLWAFAMVCPLLGRRTALGSVAVPVSNADSTAFPDAPLATIVSRERTTKTAISASSVPSALQEGHLYPWPESIPTTAVAAGEVHSFTAHAVAPSLPVAERHLPLAWITERVTVGAAVRGTLTAARQGRLPLAWPTLATRQPLPWPVQPSSAPNLHRLPLREALCWLLFGLFCGAACTVKPFGVLFLAVLLPSALWVRSRSKETIVLPACLALAGFLIPLLLAFAFLVHWHAVGSFVAILHTVLPYHASVGHASVGELLLSSGIPSVWKLLAFIALVVFASRNGRVVPRVLRFFGSTKHPASAVGPVYPFPEPKQLLATGTAPISSGCTGVTYSGEHLTLLSPQSVAGGSASIGGLMHAHANFGAPWQSWPASSGHGPIRARARRSSTAGIHRLSFTAEAQPQSSWYGTPHRLLLAACVLLGLLSFLLQAKGYSYQRYPYLAFLFVFAALEFRTALARSGRFARVAGAAGLIFATLLCAPEYLHRALKAQWPTAVTASIARDLETYAGPRGIRSLDGQVQCLDTISGCTDALLGQHLREASGTLYDELLFPQEAEPSLGPYLGPVPQESTLPLPIRNARRTFQSAFLLHPPKVVIVSSWFFPEGPGDWSKLRLWPWLDGTLRSQYRLAGQRTFPKAENGPMGYRMYVRRAP